MLPRESRSAIQRGRNHPRPHKSILLIHIIFLQHINSPAPLLLRNLPNKVQRHIPNLIILMQQPNMTTNRTRRIRRVPDTSALEDDTTRRQWRGLLQF